MSDHVLRPVHGLLEWCEWLVPVDTGETLYIFVVTVTLYTALFSATKYKWLKYSTDSIYLNSIKPAFQTTEKRTYQK